MHRITIQLDDISYDKLTAIGSTGRVSLAKVASVVMQEALSQLDYKDRKDAFRQWANAVRMDVD